MNPSIRLLHLEDDPRDAELIRLKLQAAGLSCDILWVNGREAFESALEREGALDAGRQAPHRGRERHRRQGARGVAVDITERKRAQEDVRVLNPEPR